MYTSDKPVSELYICGILSSIYGFIFREWEVCHDVIARRQNAVSHVCCSCILTVNVSEKERQTLGKFSYSPTTLKNLGLGLKMALLQIIIPNQL